MDLYPIQVFSWPFFLTSPFLFSNYTIPQNYVHWTETPESHLYTADLPGVRKEEIRVEVEDSRYLVIKTDCCDELGDATRERRAFMRKFRLPQMIDIDRISAGYEDGVLTITVPRLFVGRRRRIDPGDLREARDVVARAA